MGGTVLIVDDDVNARIIAETLLCLRGLEVRSVGDGTEACDILVHQEVAVVVLELNLPGMHGFDVLRRLRSHFGPLWLPTVPRIVVVTNRQEPEIERFALRLGAAAFLRKPVMPGRLIEVVERLVAAAVPQSAARVN